MWGHGHVQSAKARLSQLEVPKKPGSNIENPSQKEPKPVGEASVGEAAGHGWRTSLRIH